ncbi:putative HTH-type transcriptional regulator YdfH [Planctomycetes bacterium Pan216]|uniref:Putative HTH-type transcriptional regulator YdfH n=1 Tax=Kolteria novifilia TaxID=2527975 RepID=A0A518AYP7_9BACT|nr:putative HTH-type transcriptional regulator YdfH [Planctomycetes bacterium Pan216]
MTSLEELASPIRRTSLAEEVYETLLEAICGGQLAGGTKISAVALAEKLNVSRTPVIEALRRLENDGLIEASTGKQARIVEVSRDEISQIYQMRQILEGAAAEAAARRMPREALDDLEARAQDLDAGRKRLDWTERALAFDLTFHDVIAGASGNERLRADIGRYRLLVRSFCRMSGTRENLEQAFAEHLKILEAIKSRKPAAARRAMVEHIASRLDSVLQDVVDHQAETKERS